MAIYSKLVLLSILFSVFENTLCTELWDYGRNGPDVWPDIDARCGGQRQSPINIQTACTDYHQFQPFNFSTVHNQTLTFTLTNNGHTITATPNTDKLYISGADLDETYSFFNFHLHWGPNYRSGSEHQVNAIKSAGESHFVYKNDKLDKFAVLSFLMESSKSRTYQTHLDHSARPVAMDKQWQIYFNESDKLIHVNDTTTISLTLSSLMGSDLKEFWRYEGSLTTPPCTENVIWTVFRQPIYIPNYDFEAFSHDLFYESYRGPQPLYRRSVLRSFPDEIIAGIPEQRCCLKNGATARLFNIDIDSIIFPVSFVAFFYLFR